MGRSSEGFWEELEERVGVRVGGIVRELVGERLLILEDGFMLVIGCFGGDM